MREHEVPTHVQAEDKVLLWFTFPQVVAMTAVCALSYGAYRYAPVGPSEVRMALAVLLGLAGLVAVVGKIGGRRLPLVAADLLKYRLGARLYAGPPSELVRRGPPAPAQPVKSGPGPLRLMARRAGKTLRRLRPKRKGRERTGGRMPFRPHRWFGKPRRTDKDNINGNGNGDGSRKSRQSKPPKSFLAIVAAVALAAAVAVPQAALADDHWRDEIDFEVTQPGRRAAALRRGTHRLRRPGRRHPSGRNRPGHPGAGLRRAGGQLAALLGVGLPGRGGAHRLLPPPARPQPVLHLLVGGHAGAGGGRHRRGSAASLSPAGCGGGVVRSAHDFPGLDAQRGQRRHRVGVRPPHPGDHPASDGGRARQRHRDGVDGRGSYRHHGGPSTSASAGRTRASRSSPTARPASGFPSERARPSTPCPWT